MNTFTYDTEDYHQYLREFAAFLGTRYENNTLYFPARFGSGFIKLMTFSNGLQAMINNFTLHEDFTWLRMASFPEFFLLRADFVEINNEMSIAIDNTVFRDASSTYNSIVMTSSRYNVAVQISKGSVVKSVNIIISPAWLHKYFPDKIITHWLNYSRYAKLKAINMVPLDFNARASLFQLISLPDDDPAFHFNALTRIFEIADYYFKRINVHSSEWDSQQKLLVDIDKIIELDNFLTKDFSQPIPSIEEMAEKVQMSTTKLKSLFKKIYNQSIHDYFAVSRLNQGRHLLLKKNISVKEVAALMGYSAVSNFSAAFKKQFFVSPADILRSKN